MRETQASLGPRAAGARLLQLARDDERLEAPYSSFQPPPCTIEGEAREPSRGVLGPHPLEGVGLDVARENEGELHQGGVVSYQHTLSADSGTSLSRARRRVSSAA
jgi:hypothetical protein